MSISSVIRISPNRAKLNLNFSRGFWRYDEMDCDQNLSKTPLQEHLQDYFYFTTPNGFKRNLHTPKKPLLGIILPRIDTTWVDEVSYVVLHGVEDIKDYELNPYRNRIISNKRNWKSQHFGESVSIKNSNCLEEVILPAENIEHQKAIWRFMTEKGFNPDQFFSVDPFYDPY